MAQFRDYLVAVKTGNLPNSETGGSTVNITLQGLFAKCSPYLLTDSSAVSLKEEIVVHEDLPEKDRVTIPITPRHQKWRRDSWDIFRIRTIDVGGIRTIQVEKDGTDAWNLERVIVIPFSSNYSSNSDDPNDFSKTDLDLTELKTFSPKRWFDSADFDKLTSLWIHPDEFIRSDSTHSVKWSNQQVIKNAKTMIMRYDNSTGKSNIETRFTYNYSIVKGVAIDKEKTKEISTENSVSASISFGVELFGTETESEISTEFSLGIKDACTNKFGTTTTTTEEQTQEIPIKINQGQSVTLIMQVYQTTLEYEADYGDYKVPITVYDGTIDMSFKVFEGILNEADAQARAKELATIAMASLG